MLKVIAVIACALVATGCQYRDRAVSDDVVGDVGDQDGGDASPVGPPIARIRSVSADTGVLYVPLSGSVGVSGVDSTSADGTQLTGYAWTASANCLITASRPEVKRPVLYLDAASVEDGCDVSLTVTDAYGGSDTDFATLRKRDVGGYVSTHDCLSAYDPDATVPQGTEAAPFCTLDLALAAAAVNAIADIYLDAVEFVIMHTYTLPSLRYHGGYARDTASATWTLDTATPTFIAGGLTDVNAPLVVLDDHGDTALSNFSLRRTRPCTDNCVLATVSGTHATLSSVTLARVATSDWDNPSPKRNVGIAVTAAADGWPTTLDGSTLTIRGDAGYTGIGILVTGNVTVDLKAPTIRPGTGGTSSYGIRATEAATIRVHDGGVIGPLDDPSHPKVVGYAIATGRTALLPGLDTCADELGVCDAAAEVTVAEDTDLDVKHVLFASALAVAGATRVALTRVTVGAEGGSAEALRTLGAASVALDGAEVTATYLQDTSSTTHYAIGFHDGFYVQADDTYTLGSSNVSTSTGTELVATMVDYPRPVDRLIGMQLMRTAGGSFSDTVFSARGPANSAVSPGEAIGAALFETRGLAFESVADKNTFRVESIASAITTVAAFTDGDLSSTKHGSTSLLLDGNTFDAPLAGTTTSTNRVCASFHGTTNSTLSGGYFVCKAQIAETTAVGSYTNVGAWLQATDTFTIDGVGITFDYFVNAPPSPGSALTIPILDGPLPASAAAAIASNNLLINGAHIGVHSYDDVRDVGIWLRGSGTAVNRRARIFNTQVSVDSRSGTDAAIAVERVPAQIAFNTFRYGLCGAYPLPCFGTSVGLELVRTKGLAVDVTSNVFTVQNRTNSTVNAPAILDVVAQSVDVGAASLTVNAWAGDSNGAGDTHVLYRRHVATNDGTIVEAPTSADATRTEAQLKVDGGSTTAFNGNVGGTASFCNASSDDLTTSAVGRNGAPAPDRNDASYGGLLIYDTDHALRQQSGNYDIGANFRVCPGI